MKFELPKLPYELDALEPHVSTQTVTTHYTKHHQGYVDKLNNTEYVQSHDELTLEEIISTADGGVYNNAAQVWNHTFYWKCMKPNGGGKPSDSFLAILEDQFDSFDNFKKEMANCAMTQFGSGWAWLVLDSSSKLQIMSTSDAINPLKNDLTPLLTIDVWEHAYYLDYKNERNKYIDTFMESLIDWSFVESCYQNANK